MALLLFYRGFELMKSFQNYHPLIIFIYFVSVIVSTMIQLHPVFILMSFLISLYMLFTLEKRNSIYFKFTFIFYWIVALSNPLFVHEGVHILFYIGYNAITLEAIIYGLVFAALLISIINWFKILNICLDDEKILYIFKKKLPSIGLILSMVLGFIPRLSNQIQKIVETQKTLGNNIIHGSIREKITICFDMFLILITWSFESSLVTLKSMQARGYGQSYRTQFHCYRFDERDQYTLIMIVLLDLIFIFVFLTRYSNFYYYPEIKKITFQVIDILCFLSYFLLLGLPIILEKGVGRYVDL